MAAASAPPEDRRRRCGGGCGDRHRLLRGRDPPPRQLKRARRGRPVGGEARRARRAERDPDAHVAPDPRHTPADSSAARADYACEDQADAQVGQGERPEGAERVRAVARLGMGSRERRRVLCGDVLPRRPACLLNACLEAPARSAEQLPLRRRPVPLDCPCDADGGGREADRRRDVRAHEGRCSRSESPLTAAATDKQFCEGGTA